MHYWVMSVQKFQQLIVINLPSETSFVSSALRIVESTGQDASVFLMDKEYYHLLQVIPEPLKVFPSTFSLEVACTLSLSHLGWFEGPFQFSQTPINKASEGA